MHNAKFDMFQRFVLEKYAMMMMLGDDVDIVVMRSVYQSNKLFINGLNRDVQCTTALYDKHALPRVCGEK